MVFFAKSRELTNEKEVKQLLTSPTTISKVKEEILLLYPCLQPISDNFVIAINQNYVDEQSIQLNENDEVAVIPPISGG